MNKKDFRAELERVLPGFKWKLMHWYNDDKEGLRADGTLIGGYTRNPKLIVEVFDGDSGPRYTVSDNIWGNRDWSGEEKTLPRAVRLRQNYYEREAGLFDSYARVVEAGRKRR